MTCWRIRSLALALLCVAPALFALPDERWSFISNDYVRLGVITNYGATIGHFSLVSAGVNFVNYMDAGRMIQQSYYGDADGSWWAGNPWHWNPVQGGSYANDKPALLAFSNVNNRIYARVHPRNWAGRQLLTNVVMEEWIDLTGNLAHIVFKMTYTGPSNYAARHQEVPAAFLNAAYPRLTYYDGPCPWSGGPLTNFQPVGVNNYDDSTESWWAYVNGAGYGMGIMTPPATTFATYYWIAGSGNEGGGCSYVSPIQVFGITPNFSYQYDVYLTIGTTNDMRARFAAARSAADGHWTAGSGVWTNPANWIAGFVANGVGASAYFTNAIAADASIFPYAPQTIGNLVVNDADGSSNAFSIRDGSNDFTLAGAGPTINCATRLNLLPVVCGTQGFTKIGAGILNLGLTSNLISGPVKLYQGSEILLNHYQALLNADVTVTGTLVKSQKMQLNANSLTVGRDGKLDTFLTDTGANTTAVALIVRNGITVNSGGQLGAGLADGVQGQPFALLAPAITVNAGGQIRVNNNMAATSIATAGISGSNIVVNSGGDIMFAAHNAVFTIDNPLTLSGVGTFANIGALLTAANNISLTNNSPITLAGNARIGQYGVGGYMVMNQPIGGTGDLTWHTQAAAGTHPKTYLLRAQNTYAGKTILSTYAAAPTYVAGVHQAFPNTAFEAVISAYGTTVAYYDLATFTQAVASLKMDLPATDTFDIRGDAGAALHVGGDMDFNGGTTLVKLPVRAGNQQCQVNGGAALVISNATLDIRPWGQLRPLWSGSGTATVSICSGTVQCYSVRIADGIGTPIVNVNAGGELNFADMYDGNGTPASGRVNINGGTLSDSAAAVAQTNWIYKITPSKDWAVELKAGGATFDIAHQYRAVLVPITGSSGGDLTKTGAQTLALEAVPTFDGDIHVQEGELRVNCDISGLSGSVNLSAGARLGGTGRLGAMTIPAGATLAAGNSVGILSFSALTLGAGSTNLWEHETDTNDIVDVTGNLTVAGTSYISVVPHGAASDDPSVTNWVYRVDGTLTGFNNLVLDLSAAAGWQGNLVQVGNNVGVVLTPEPASGLLALALASSLRKLWQQ